MFNQTKLELLPSIRVACFLALPCLASLVLILLADIPIIFTVLLVFIHIYISYHCISKYAFLASADSICSIHIENSIVYLEDKMGYRYIATLLPKSFIHPIFSLLSFKCEPIMTDVKSANKKYNYDSLTHLDAIFYFFKHRIFSSPRRHLFICRYNTSNSSAYRRARVWFKFS